MNWLFLILRSKSIFWFPRKAILQVRACCRNASVVHLLIEYENQIWSTVVGVEFFSSILTPTALVQKGIRVYWNYVAGFSKVEKLLFPYEPGRPPLDGEC